MGNDLFVLRTKGIMVVYSDGVRCPAYFLQLAIRNALSQDAQLLLERTLREAREAWQNSRAEPELAVQVGFDGIPREGAPIFRWGLPGRVHCFESELGQATGCLGEREIRGFRFHCAEGSTFSGDRSTAGGRMGEHGSIPFDYHWYSERQGCRGNHMGLVNPRLLKIVGLIRLIESKGRRASQADLQYLGHLREKAAQLGRPSCSCP